MILLHSKERTETFESFGYELETNLISFYCMIDLHSPYLLLEEGFQTFSLRVTLIRQHSPIYHCSKTSMEKHFDLH